jgi:hypothetical protein
VVAVAASLFVGDFHHQRVTQWRQLEQLGV